MSRLRWSPDFGRRRCRSLELLNHLFEVRAVSQADEVVSEPNGLDLDGVGHEIHGPQHSAKRLPSLILVLSMYGRSKRDTETDKKKK